MLLRRHWLTQEENLAAVRWYNDREPGLGAGFQQSVERMGVSLCEWPDSSPVWPGWDRLPVVYTAHLPGPWPYKVVYFTQDDRLITSLQ